MQDDFLKDIKFEVTEIFKSLQGEGVDSGSPAVFVRLAGCNLSCNFCDTKFPVNMTLSGVQLLKQILDIAGGTRLIVFTGGEPLLQPVIQLVPMLRGMGLYVGVETNGTIEVDSVFFTSLSLSPKVPFMQCKVQRCHSLKLLYPYLHGATPEDYKSVYAGYKFIQPIWVEGDMVRTKQIIQEAAAEVIRLGDGWKLGLQIHKFIGIQ